MIQISLTGEILKRISTIDEKIFLATVLNFRRLKRRCTGMRGDTYTQEIIDWAKIHDNHISYVVVVDMLKSKDKEFDIVNDVETVLEELADAGIVVENGEESED